MIAGVSFIPKSNKVANMNRNRMMASMTDLPANFPRSELSHPEVKLASIAQFLRVESQSE